MSASADDDPIADAIVSEDPERTLRYADWALFGRYSLPTKLRGIGAVSAGTALTLFVVITTRRPALESALQTAPFSATVAATVLLATGLKFLTIGSFGLSLVGYMRRRDDPHGPDAEQLFGFEETATLLGFGIGGLGVLLGICFLLVLALSGTGSVPAFAARLADPVPLPVTYGVVFTWSVALACFVSAASLVFDGAR